MKKFLKITLNAALLLILSNAYSQISANSISKSDVEKENFYVFLYDFSQDIKYQTERTRFPLLMCDVEPNSDSVCTELLENKWEHKILLKVPEIIFMSSNFNTPKIEDTDQRIFSILGIENGIGSYYYFLREEGRWYLIKVVNYL